MTSFQMYSIDCGNYETKVAVKERMDTTTLCDKMYQRWHLSAIRHLEDHREFGHHGKGAQLNLAQHFYSMTSTTAKEVSSSMYEFFCHVKREYGLPDDAAVVLTTGLSLPLRLIFSTLTIPIFAQTILVPNELSVASRIFFSYQNELASTEILVCEGFIVGEFEVKSFVARLSKEAIQILEVEKLGFGAFHFDEVVCELCGGCSYESNIEAIKRCRQVLSLNDVAHLTLVERDADVQKQHYLQNCRAYIKQLTSLLLELRQRHRVSIFEATGGAARDAVCLEAITVAAIEEERRLNWEESEASGALIFETLTRRMRFSTILDGDIEVLLARNGQDIETGFVAPINTTIPTTLQFQLALKPHMHIKLVCRSFLLRVYEFAGVFPRTVQLTMDIQLNGDAVLVCDNIKEIFNYCEKQLLDGLQAEEKVLYERDCLWERQEV